MTEIAGGGGVNGMRLGNDTIGHGLNFDFSRPMVRLNLEPV